MEIDTKKTFKFFDINGDYLGNGNIEAIIHNKCDPKVSDAYIVKFDTGDIKCLNVTECNFQEHMDGFEDISTKKTVNFNLIHVILYSVFCLVGGEGVFRPLSFKI
jgi:hypothetical protein